MKRIDQGTANVVVALHVEAQPIADHFSLEPASGCEPFSVFSGDHLRLIVSGVGKFAAAGFLFRFGGTWHDEAWLNVGIGGHANLTLGSVHLAHKVTEQSTGSSWYPPRVFDAPCPTAEVCCVDGPE